MALTTVRPQGMGFVTGRRNLIINGAMQVAQRGTQTGQTGTVYTACDRFLTAEVGDTVTTSSQDTDVPSGQGFANSLKIDVTTADASLAASDVFLVMTRLEGQNLQHLLYGTSNAKALTLSFWVKSPKAGTHILELRQNDATYFNSQAYTVASANTWQKVELTFSGYTATAFDNDNAYSLGITWFLAAGSNYSSGTLSSNTWHNTQANRAVGQVNCVDDAANNFYITGVQLEVGTNASDFEHRSYGEELALCQRYYFKFLEGSTKEIGVAWYYTAAHASFMLRYPTTMRATPTGIDTTGTGYYTIYRNAGSDAINSITFENGSTEQYSAYNNTEASGTAGQAGLVRSTNASSKVEFDAEL